MADIVNPDGTTTPVPDSGLETALKSGRFKPRSSMTTVGPDGDAYDVPPEHITEYLNAGHHLVPRAQAQHMANVKEAGEHPIEAGLVGAASGVFPGANAALAGVGGPSLERQGELHEGNPLAFGIGQGVGNVGQAIGVGALTGGVGEGAELGRLGTLGVQAAKDAALFGAQGAQNELNEQSLGDHHFNGEAVVAQAGLGAILGGITAPAIGLAREFIPSPISAAGKALSKLADSTNSLIANVVPRLRADVATVPGQEFLGMAAKSAGEGAENATIDTKNKILTNWAKNSDAVDDGMYKLSRSINAPDGLFKQAIDKEAGAVPYNVVKAGSDDFMSQNAMQTVRNLLSGAGTDSYGQPIKVAVNEDIRNAVMGAVTDTQSALKEASAGGDSFDAWNDLQKSLSGKQVMNYSAPVSTSAAKESIQQTKSIIEKNLLTPLRQFLNNPAIWGEGARLNSIYKDATTDLIKGTKSFDKLLGHENLISDTVRPAIETSPSKAEKLFSGEDKLVNQSALAVHDFKMKAVQKYIDMASELAKSAGANLDNTEMQGLLTKLSAGQRVAEAGSKLSTQGSFINGNFKAYLAGGAAHALTGGMPGAFNVGFGAVKAGQLLHHPASVIEAFGKIKYLADLHTTKIAKAAADFMQRTGRIAGPILGRDVLDSTHFKAGSDSQSRSEETDYQKRVSEIRNLASNPTLLENTLSQKTSGMADAAPNTTMAAHASALASLKALDAAIPQPPQQYAIQEDFKPDPEQMRQFEATYAVATNPLKAIAGSLLEGTITPGMVTLANQIAPQTMAELRRQIGNQMVDKPDRDYSLKQQFGMTMVLGVPVSPATDPAQIMFQQQVLMPQPMPPPPSGGKTRASGLAKLDVAQQTELPGQARQIDTRSA